MTTNIAHGGLEILQLSNPSLGEAPRGACSKNDWSEGLIIEIIVSRYRIAKEKKLFRGPILAERQKENSEESKKRCADNDLGSNSNKRKEICS